MHQLCRDQVLPRLIFVLMNNCISLSVFVEVSEVKHMLESSMTHINSSFSQLSFDIDTYTCSCFLSRHAY